MLALSARRPFRSPSQGLSHAPRHLERLHQAQPRLGPREGIYRHFVQRERVPEPAPQRVPQPDSVQEVLPDPRRGAQRRDRQGLPVRQGPVRHHRHGRNRKAPHANADRSINIEKFVRPELLDPIFYRRQDLLPHARRTAGTEAVRTAAPGPGRGKPVRACSSRDFQPRTTGGAAADGQAAGDLCATLRRGAEQAGGL